jgi:hypothetical protein
MYISALLLPAVRIKKQRRCGDFSGLTILSSVVETGPLVSETELI